MNSVLFEKFIEIDADMWWIGLAKEDDYQYYCTPIGAEIIGQDNGIHYCFIPEFGEMVLCVNPESCCDYNVYLLAENFEDYIRILLATKHTNTFQQIIL